MKFPGYLQFNLLSQPGENYLTDGGLNDCDYAKLSDAAADQKMYAGVPKILVLHSCNTSPSQTTCPEPQVARWGVHYVKRPS